MWVVKLGGSLLGSTDLPKWLEMCSRISDGKIVIVPGGGVFADAVRAAQQSTDVNDGMAHRLALLAMDQFGWLMTALCPALVTAGCELEIAERCWQHRCVVWLPSKMVMADEKIPQNWQVTSDSLAAWLANKLNASHVVLVKSAQLPQTQHVSLHHLEQEGIVDEAYALFYEASFHSLVIQADQQAQFETAFYGSGQPGLEITLP